MDNMLTYLSNGGEALQLGSSQVWFITGQSPAADWGGDMPYRSNRWPNNAP